MSLATSPWTFLSLPSPLADEIDYRLGFLEIMTWFAFEGWRSKIGCFSITTCWLVLVFCFPIGNFSLKFFLWRIVSICFFLCCWCYWYSQPRIFLPQLFDCLLQTPLWRSSQCIKEHMCLQLMMFKGLKSVWVLVFGWLSSVWYYISSVCIIYLYGSSASTVVSVLFLIKAQHAQVTSHYVTSISPLIGWNNLV